MNACPAGSPRLTGLVPLLLALTSLYLLLFAALTLLGRSPALPVGFVPYLLVLSVPTAVTLMALAALPSRSARIGGVLLSIPVALLANIPSVWLVAALIVIFLTPRLWDAPTLTALSASLATMGIGYAAVWAANYLVVLVVPTTRLWDTTLRTVDAHVWGWVGQASYVGLFPLIREPWTFSVLECSYAFLFTEVLLVSLLL